MLIRDKLLFASWRNLGGGILKDSFKSVSHWITLDQHSERTGCSSDFQDFGNLVLNKVGEKIKLIY